MNIKRLRFLLILLACLGAGWLLAFSLLSYLWREEENYTLIDDGLYLGGDAPRPPPVASAVLNLCEKPDPYRVEVALWEPVADAEPAPDLDWLRRMVEFVDANHRSGRTTFVHCRNGVSRSGMVVVAYEMSKNHCGRDEALAFVRSKRPQVLPNPAFMMRLSEWEAVLRAKPPDERP